MSRTAEYAPPQTKSTEQEPYVEEANTAEILTEKFRRELADLGFVSLFHEAYDDKGKADDKVSGKPLSEDEKLWAKQFESTGWQASDKVPGNVLFVMLIHALNRLNELEQEQTKTGKAKVKKPAQTSSFTSTSAPYEPPQMSFPAHNWDPKAYVRQAQYKPFDVASGFGKWNRTHGQPEASVKPDFVPAPSMSDAKMGPDLPRLHFNDRVRPENARPTTGDFNAAARSDDLLTKSLFKQGWTGGEATPEQMRAAKLDMIRSYHPDRGTNVSPENVEAFTSFSSSRSHEQKATAGEQAAREARQAAKAAEATPTAQPRPETASNATATPAQPKTAPVAQHALPAAPSAPSTPSAGAGPAPSAS